MSNNCSYTSFVLNNSTIEYQGWKVKVTQNLLTVEKCDEIRIYDLPDFETMVHDEEYIYITLKDGTIYQYKMEVDNFFAGDMFDKEGNHIDVTACHVFGEE
jgi:hypothetical protein